MSDVLVISPEPIRGNVAGSAIRAMGIARACRHAGYDVLIASPDGDDRRPGAPPTCGLGRLGQVIGSAASVVAPAGMAMQLTPLRRARHLVVDFPGPFPLEAQLRYGDCGASRAALFSARCALEAADAILVSQPRQRAYVEELLGESRTTILELPFSIPDGAPPEGAAPPGRPPLLVWPGGLWPWLDPVLALDALDASGSDCRIEFWGAIPGDDAHTGLLREIGSRALTERVSIVPWMRPDEFFPRLAAADAAMTFDRGDPERGLAFRTRLLHSLWVGTPLIAPAGEWVTDIAAAAGAAWTPLQSPESIGTVMRQISESRNLLLNRSNAARASVSDRTYDVAASDLLNVLGRPGERVGDRNRIGLRSRVTARAIRAGIPG